MNYIDFLIDFFLNPWTIISLIFWAFVGILVILLRNKKESYTLFFPFLILFRTKRLNSIIKKIGKKYPRAWRSFWTIGIFVSFGFTIFGFWLFFSNLIDLFISPSIQNAVTPLIPGVTIDLPLFAFIFLPLLLVVTTHELAHGIAASADDVEIESTGVLGGGIFWLIGFGAFVEVNERELQSKKYNRRTRLRISAAGTYVNAITAGIALIMFFLTPLFISLSYSEVPQVYGVMDIQQGGYNYGNITAGDNIIAIKNASKPYTSLDYYQGSTLSSVLNEYSVGDILTVRTYTSWGGFIEKEILLGPEIPLNYTYKNDTTILINYNYSSGSNLNILINKINDIQINRSEGITFWSFRTDFSLDRINLTTIDGMKYSYQVKDGNPYIGITRFITYMYKNEIGHLFTNFFPDLIFKEIGWLFLIAFSVTIFNMLPLPIFDGDRIVKELINWVVGERYDEKEERDEQFLYTKESITLELSEYRIEEITSITFSWGKNDGTSDNKITLGEDNYRLIDTIGDGFKSTLSLDLPETSRIQEGAEIKVSYIFWKDSKTQLKKAVLNSIRVITLFIVILNFIISIIQFGLDPLGFL